MAALSGLLENRVVRAALLIATAGIALGIGGFVAGWSLVCVGGQCPSVDVLELYQPRQTSKLYATDGRFLTPIGIPTYGVSGIFSDGATTNAHGLNERIRVQSLMEGREFLHRLTKMYAGGK